MRNIRAIPRSMLASALSVGLLFAAGQTLAAVQSTQAAEAEEEAKAGSDQPVNDTWITTKVKSELAVADGVSATEISVDTTNGVVKLSGKVDSKDEIKKAAEVAKKVKGVKKVDSSGLTVGND
jgi:hyperosmotically inducible periplasmic protein